MVWIFSEAHSAVFMYFFFCSPVAYVDPCHCNMAQVFLELLTDSLNEYGYDAEVAGVDYKLEQTMYGLCVSKGHTKQKR